VSANGRQSQPTNVGHNDYIDMFTVLPLHFGDK
jgi:hypothetical protein